MAAGSSEGLLSDDVGVAEIVVLTVIAFCSAFSTLVFVVAGATGTGLVSALSWLDTEGALVLAGGDTGVEGVGFITQRGLP